MKRTLLLTALLAASPAFAQYYDDDDRRYRLEERSYNDDGRFRDAYSDGSALDEVDELERQLAELRTDRRVLRFAERELIRAEEFVDRLRAERRVDIDELDEGADLVEAVRLAALEGAGLDDRERVVYDDRHVEFVGDDDALADARDAQDAAARARQEAEAERERALAAKLEAEHARNRNARLRAELVELKARETDRGMVVTLGDVLFEVGKADLKPGATRTLDKLAAAMKQSPAASVIVEGHTDSTGGHAYNIGLSQRRATSVRNYLVRKGVAAARIEASGMGPDAPVASNNTASGRQQNRRVELIVQNEVADARRVSEVSDDDGRR